MDAKLLRAVGAMLLGLLPVVAPALGAHLGSEDPTLGTALCALPGAVPSGDGCLVPLPQPASPTSGKGARLSGNASASSAATDVLGPGAPVYTEQRGCTLGFLLRHPETGAWLGLSAGHCAEKDGATFYLKTSKGPVAIGEAWLRRTGDPMLGDDWLVLRIREDLPAHVKVDPTMAGVGGPCGRYERHLAGYTVVSYGGYAARKASYGLGSFPEAHTAAAGDRGAVAWSGIAAPGDSGSPVRITRGASGAAPAGHAEAAVGILTYVQVTNGQTVVWGTNVTKILQEVARRESGWALADGAGPCAERGTTGPVKAPEAPRVTIDAPAAGATLSGLAEVRGRAAASILVAVLVRVGAGAWQQATVADGVWSLRLDTTRLANHDHALVVRAVAGETATEARAAFRVANAPTVDLVARAVTCVPSNLALVGEADKARGGHDASLDAALPTCRMSVTVSNDGNSPSGAFRLRVEHERADGSWGVVSDREVPSFGGLQRHVVTWDWHAAQVGGQRLRAVVDAPGLVAETEEGNNQVQGLAGFVLSNQAAEALP